MLTDTQMMANLGEIAAWLMEDDTAAARFAAWYNDASDRLDVPKDRVDGSDVQYAAKAMFEQAARTVAAAT
jgi:hypothetical protein